MKARIMRTSETIISKIFPAGAGWQTGMIIANNNAYSPLATCLSVGAGEATGLAMGHLLFSGIKSAYRNKTWNAKKELGTSALLGSASFGSGAIWQPVVDTSKFLYENTKYLLSYELNQLNPNINITPNDLEFYSVAGTTGLVCGFSFYLGLRIYRRLFSLSIFNSLIAIDNANKQNAKYDRQLSLSIGGATGAFVATDPALLGNPAQYLVINNNTISKDSIIIAGTSTGIGFSSIQSIQNLLVRRNRSWLD